MDPALANFVLAGLKEDTEEAQRWYAPSPLTPLTPLTFSPVEYLNSSTLTRTLLKLMTFPEYDPDSPSASDDEYLESHDNEVKLKIYPRYVSVILFDRCPYKVNLVRTKDGQVPVIKPAGEGGYTLTWPQSMGGNLAYAKITARGIITERGWYNARGEYHRAQHLPALITYADNRWWLDYYYDGIKYLAIEVH